ncbi:MAG: hypothetical protein D4R82_00480 [Dehalococcoidia bacterium]|nr:MAG: hypothetical protein D4R82_00480 [Dehalococcoidia bacterium]
MRSLSHCDQMQLRSLFKLIINDSMGSIGRAQTISEGLQGSPEDQSQTIGNEGEGFGNSPRDQGRPRNGLTGVAEILGIEQMKLEDAFTQAGGGIMDRA